MQFEYFVKNYLKADNKILSHVESTLSLSKFVAETIRANEIITLHIDKRLPLTRLQPSLLGKDHLNL